MSALPCCREHAASVLQMTHVLLQRGGLIPHYADPLTTMATLLAACIHDFEHAGAQLLECLPLPFHVRKYTYFAPRLPHAGVTNGWWNGPVKIGDGVCA